MDKIGMRNVAYIQTNVEMFFTYCHGSKYAFSKKYWNFYSIQLTFTLQKINETVVKRYDFKGNQIPIILSALEGKLSCVDVSFEKPWLEGRLYQTTDKNFLHSSCLFNSIQELKNRLRVCKLSNMYICFK